MLSLLSFKELNTKKPKMKNLHHIKNTAQNTMKLLIKGIKVKRDIKNDDEDDDDDEDIDMNQNENINDFSSYPLKTRLEKIESMLQFRTNSVIEFLEFIESQMNDSNEMNLRSYIENISKQMNECWKSTQSMIGKYGKDSIIHKQQLLLEENWTLSLNYKSLHRHYQYITKYPHRVHRDEDINNIDINNHGINGNVNDPNNSNNNNYTQNGINGGIKNGNINNNSHPQNGVNNDNDNNDNNTKNDKKCQEIESVEIDAMKNEISYLKEKCEKQRVEMDDLENKLSESEKSTSHYKGKYENFLRQINESNTNEQGDEFEKEFLKNIHEFSFTLQSEFRDSLQKQAKEKEKSFKQQIEKLNKTLSDTKNKLFQSQVKCIKKRNNKTQKQIKIKKESKDNKDYKDHKDHKEKKTENGIKEVVKIKKTKIIKIKTKIIEKVIKIKKINHPSHHHQEVIPEKEVIPTIFEVDQDHVHKQEPQKKIITKSHPNQKHFIFIFIIIIIIEKK